MSDMIVQLVRTVSNPPGPCFVPGHAEFFLVFPVVYLAQK